MKITDLVNKFVEARQADGRAERTLKDSRRVLRPSEGQDAEQAKTMFEPVIQEYLIAARQAGKSEGTLRQYGWNLRKMVAWLADRQVDQPNEVTRALLREWGAELYKRWSPATIKQAVSAAKSFFAWCHDEGVIGENVGLVLKLPKVKKRIQRTLSVVEILALIGACDTDTTRGVRDLALVSLLVDSGLRAQEICGLQIADVDLEAKQLIVTGKGGDEGYGRFSAVTARYLRSWLEVRPALFGINAFFVSIGGTSPHQALTTRGLRIILRKLGKQAGVPGVSPHAFRRAFACIATEAGASTRALQMWGRWEDIRMVERYTQGLEAARLYEQFSPMTFIEKGNGGARQLPLFEL